VRHFVGPRRQEEWSAKVSPARPPNTIQSGKNFPESWFIPSSPFRSLPIAGESPTKCHIDYAVLLKTRYSFELHPVAAHRIDVIIQILWVRGLRVS
jgi:hypothetical protein